MEEITSLKIDLSFKNSNKKLAIISSFCNNEIYYRADQRKPITNV